MPRVYVLDDSPVVLAMTVEGLRAAGYEARGASDLASFDVLLKEGEPDVVLLDVRMPEMFGDDVLEFLRTEKQLKARLLLFSDVDGQELSERAKRVGADGTVPKHKGLTISGKAGDPVLASADGRVVYAGSGLRGYGNLVILKHGGDYLTAYAHNQTLLVKEDQVVRKGQKIAEMGSTDSDRVQLHFEIRKGGKPVDPAKQLPSR
mgnify:CR=1 FL=1